MQPARLEHVAVQRTGGKIRGAPAWHSLNLNIAKAEVGKVRRKLAGGAIADVAVFRFRRSKVVPIKQPFSAG